MFFIIFTASVRVASHFRFLDLYICTCSTFLEADFLRLFFITKQAKYIILHFEKKTQTWKLFVKNVVCVCTRGKRSLKLGGKCGRLYRRLGIYDPVLLRLRTLQNRLKQQKEIETYQISVTKHHPTDKLFWNFLKENC